MAQRTAFIIIIMVAGFTACKQKTKEVQPQMKQLTEAVYASGTLVPENEYKVVSSSEGFLQKALVKEGDTVKKGQLLFSLSNDNQQVQVNAASELFTKTMPVTAVNGPAVKEVENKLAAAKTRLENDLLQYNRYKNLYDQKAISASNYEKYKLQYETTQHDVQSLEEQLNQQHLSAALQLQQASNQLQVARTSQSNGLLKSYADGVVYDVYKQTGDMIMPNQPVALIGSGKMIAKLLVDQDDLQKIWIGQKILITMDAFPDKVLHATVKKIYPMLNKVEQSFRVDAVFDETLPLNMYGLNVEANIVLSEKTKAIVIPKNAVLKGDTVLVKEADKITKVKIKKGAEDKDYVQVLGGISNSSILIIQQ
jgi:multidrug efflux pump subunit AcrA (membrane-fusion protein)